MRIQKPNRKKGLTLIELMIVVIIIGVLAGLAITRYSRTVKEAKLREAALMLAYLWDIQYSYYLQHGSFIYEESTWGYTIFELDGGNSPFWNTNNDLLSELGYNPPSAKSHFYYISWWLSGGIITWAYPKTSDSGWGFPDDEVDDGLRNIYLVVDNDRSIFVYGFGRKKQL